MSLIVVLLLSSSSTLLNFFGFIRSKSYGRLQYVYVEILKYWVLGVKMDLSGCIKSRSPLYVVEECGEIVCKNSYFLN